MVDGARREYQKGLSWGVDGMTVKVPETREEMVAWFRFRDMVKAAEVLDRTTTKIEIEKYTHSVLTVIETGDLGDYIELINDIMHGYRTQEGMTDALFVYISKSDPNVVYMIFWRGSV